MVFNNLESLIQSPTYFYSFFLYFCLYNIDRIRQAWLLFIIAYVFFSFFFFFPTLIRRIVKISSQPLIFIKNIEYLIDNLQYVFQILVSN